VFDYDCEHDGTDIWAPLFGCLNAEEMLEVLKMYPSTIKYASHNVIQKWIESLKNDYGEYEIDTLFTLKSILGLIQDISVEAQVRKIIYDFADREAEKIEKEYSSWPTFNENSIIYALRNIRSLTGQDYKEVISNCKETIAKRDFLSILDQFKKYGYESDKLITAYNKMSSSSQEEHAEDFRITVKERLNILLEKKNIWHLFGLLERYSFWGQDFINPFYEKALPIAKEDVLSPLKQNVNDLNLISQFSGSLYRLKRFYSDQTFEDLIENAKLLLLKATSVFALSKIREFDFITKEEIFEQLKIAISNWSFADAKKYFDSERELFDDDDEFRQMVINKTFEIIGSKQVSKPFDESIDKDDYYPDIETSNCNTLLKFRDYLGKEIFIKRWNEYIQSLDNSSIMALYRNGVIPKPTQGVCLEIINNLSVDDFYDGSEMISFLIPNAVYDGYTRPVLKDKEKEEIVKSSKDLFSFIEKRVLGIDLVPENFSLVICLLELVRLKCSKDANYYEKRQWNQQLSYFINSLITHSSGDAKLKTILWAVFFQSSASLKTLTEIFSDLLPYVQINAVKKLFQLIDQGKLNHNAVSLYKLLGGGERHLCFPLEMTFAYLKLRTENPKATFTNNLMLQLLYDREDHREWVKIKHLLHQCNGRVHVGEDDDRWGRNKFYNGFVDLILTNVIQVFVPNKMCDIDRDPQDYNNKYFNPIKEYVKLNFVENPPKIKDKGDSYELYFKKDQEIEVLNMARVFNLCYREEHMMPLLYTVNPKDSRLFCECRQALKLDNQNGEPFYWCGGYPCYRWPVRFMLNNEWEKYSILDFMRILKIPVDYISSKGITRFGHYIILNSFLFSFRKFYSHLECRTCKKLMKPNDMSNFATRAVTEFSCANDECENFGKVVYLNHCFNKKNCDATIDSRDSKQCPNGQYICPECGACCSTQNFANRLANLRFTGGAISPWLENFVNSDLGHWEKNEFYCYKCGKKLVNGKCPDCGTTY